MTAYQKINTPTDALCTFPLQVKYKEKYEKAKGHYVPVLDTPQILHSKAVRSLVSEVRTIQRTPIFSASFKWNKKLWKSLLVLKRGFCIFSPQSKYKEASKKDMQSGSFTTLSETRDTAHSKEINKLVSGVCSFHQSELSRIIDILYVGVNPHIVILFYVQKLYKAKFEKEKGKSEYNNMTVPPDVQHAMDVARNQSSVS